MQKSKIKISISLLAVMFTAAACGLVPDQPAKLTELIWWKTFDDGRALQPVISAFQKSNPGIKITFVQKNVDTYEAELIDALAAGEGPDIFTIHNDWLPRYQDKLTPAPAKVWNIKDYKQAFVDAASFDLVDYASQQIYAVPLSMDVLSLYYNKDLLASAGIARPPATWQDLVAQVPKLTRQDSLGNFLRSAVALGTADNINRAPDILGLMMLQNGTSVYSPDHSKTDLGSIVQGPDNVSFTPAVRALEFYTQFSNPAKTTYTWNSRSLNSIDAFAAGKVAMIFSYSYLAGTLAQKAPFLKYGIAAVPQIEGADLRVNFANYWAEGVAKQSEHPTEAWQFLKYISQKNVLSQYYTAVKHVASRPDILESQITDPDIGVFAENALSAKSFFKPDSDAVETIFVQMINDVVLRNVQPADAVRAASQKINLLLRSQ